MEQKDEDITCLAQFYGIEKENIENIEHGEGYAILRWKTPSSIDTVFVSDYEISFVDDNEKNEQNAGFLEIQWLLDRGYKIFKTKGE